MSTLAMFLLFVAAGSALITLSHETPFPFLLDALASTPSRWQMPVHEADRARAYLTHNDGPDPTATLGLLDVLAREQAIATFFLLDRHLSEDAAPIV